MMGPRITHVSFINVLPKEFDEIPQSLRRRQLQSQDQNLGVNVNVVGCAAPGVHGDRGCNTYYTIYGLIWLGLSYVLCVKVLLLGRDRIVCN